MKKYGKSLVNAVPDEATKLLKVLCTDYRPQRVQERELDILRLFIFLSMAFVWEIWCRNWLFASCFEPHF